MPKAIDRDKVYWMLRTGFHPKAIARRLGCSRRQIDRIIDETGWDGTRHLTSFSSEKELWAYYLVAWDESYSKIANRFGVTRQAVSKYFKSIQRGAA